MNSLAQFFMLMYETFRYPIRSLISHQNSDTDCKIFRLVMILYHGYIDSMYFETTLSLVIIFVFFHHYRQNLQLECSS